MMSASSTRNMRISLSIASTYFSFGTFVMMIAAPFTIAALGWRGLWHVNAAIFLVVLIALLASIYISDRPGAHRPTHGFSWSDLARSARNPGPWLLSIMFVLMSLCTFSVMAWLPTFLIDKLNYDRTTAALLAGLYVAGMIPFNLLGGLLLQRGVQRWVLFVISAAAIAVFPCRYFCVNQSGLGPNCVCCGVGTIDRVHPRRGIRRGPALCQIGGGEWGRDWHAGSRKCTGSTLGTTIARIAGRPLR